MVASWLVLAFIFAYVFPYIAYTTGSPGPADAEVSRYVLSLEMSPARAPDVAISAMPLFGGAMMTVLGVLTTGSGHSWQHWKTASTHAISRRQLISGPIAAASCLAAALVVLVMVLGLSASLLVAEVQDLPVEVPELPVWMSRSAIGFAVLEMWLLLGCALGVIFRGTSLALGLALIWTLVVENLLRGFSNIVPALRHLTDLLPGTATGSLVNAVTSPAPGEVTPGILSDLAGGRAGVTVALYAVLGVVAAQQFFARRDLT